MWWQTITFWICHNFSRWCHIVVPLFHLLLKIQLMVHVCSALQLRKETVFMHVTAPNWTQVRWTNFSHMNFPHKAPQSSWKCKKKLRLKWPFVNFLVSSSLMAMSLSSFFTRVDGIHSQSLILLSFFCLLCGSVRTSCSFPGENASDHLWKHLFAENPMHVQLPLWQWQHLCVQMCSATFHLSSAHKNNWMKKAWNGYGDNATSWWPCAHMLLGMLKDLVNIRIKHQHRTNSLFGALLEGRQKDTTRKGFAYVAETSSQLLMLAIKQIS